MKLPKIISIAALKGGTGKTTITFNVASALARTSKVLVIDFDPQGNLSSNLNLNIFDIERDSIANIFEDINISPFDILEPSPIEELPNLDLLPSSMYLLGTELNLANRPAREKIFKSYLKKNEMFFSQYDYIILDTAPNVGIVNQNAFYVSDHIILVLDPDCNSARGADLFLQLWGDACEVMEIPNTTDSLVINNIERIKMSSKLTDYISSHPELSKMFIDAPVIHTTRFKECGEQNLPIHLLKTKNKQEEQSRQRAEDCINNLVQELIERGVF